MDDILEKVQEIVEKLRTDKTLLRKFKTEPVEAIEDLLDIDLPEDKINDIVKAVKAKIDLDAIGDFLDSDGDGKPDLGALGKLGGLFK